MDTPILLLGMMLSFDFKKLFKRYDLDCLINQTILLQGFLNQKSCTDSLYEFIIRGKHDIDDFLYEIDSPFASKHGAIAFDYIDMVFMEGDPNLLPWSPAASKVNFSYEFDLKELVDDSP